MDAAISVQGLRKSYGDFEAVRGIDFDVAKGEVFGLLGPNGAGKTTTVEILEGLRPRTAGNVTVLGYDPAKEVRSLKDRIGVCLQATNLPDKILVKEALELFSAFIRATPTTISSSNGCNSGKNATALFKTLGRPKAARGDCPRPRERPADRFPSTSRPLVSTRRSASKFTASSAR
jgi:ABC-2 type transport system ATP-binding protein